MADVADLRGEIETIESALDSGSYTPGPWSRLVRDVRNSPREQRRALADDLSRVSRKLHLRGGRRTMALDAALLTEFAAAMLGALLLGVGTAAESNVCALIGLVLWASTFQPSLKVACGRLLGVKYDYAYLAYLEPRFKMTYGSYLALPRWARIVTHAAGTIGSPLGAICAWLLTTGRLPLAATVSLAVFWAALAINLLSLITALAGTRRIGPLRMEVSSGGAAGVELREALGR